MCVCTRDGMCVEVSSTHVGVGGKVELRLERFGSKSFPAES